MGNSCYKMEIVNNQDFCNFFNLTSNDADLGVDNFWCSHFIESEKILIKGEKNNRNQNRNAILILVNLRNGKIRGKFLLTYPGHGLSSNSSQIYSVNFVKYNQKNFVLCSGNGRYLNIFKFEDFSPDFETRNFF